MLLLYIIAGLVFAGVAVPLVTFYLESRAVRLEKRMREIRSPAVAPDSIIAQELEESFWQRLIEPLLDRISEIIVKITPAGAVDATREKLQRAGNPGSLDVSTFIMIRVVALIAGVAGAVMIVTFWNTDNSLLLHAAAALSVAISVMLPNSLLDSVAKTRQYQITKALPDIIDLLVVSAEAGAGLDGALAQVVKRKDGPLADEFDRVLTEVRLGKRRMEAWQDMADRCGVEDLQNLVSALQQAEDLGVSIGNTLRTQGEALRTRRRLRIRTAAATLSTKMLFPMIFCIFPSLFVVVLGPGMMSIMGAMKGIGW